MNRSLRIFALLVAGALAFPLAAADFSALQPQGYVSDFARVINPAHRAELERYCARVEQQTGAQLAFVTIPTLDGEPIEDVANNLFRRWGIGQKGKNEGLMLLFAIGNRRMRMEVGYGLEGIVPDGYAGEILDRMRPLLRSGEWGPAMLEAAHTLGSRIAEEKGVTLDVTLPSRRPPRQDVQSIGGMIVPILFFLFLLWLMSRNGGGGGPRYGRRGGWGVIPMGGGGWGGSGGGFGGYDSGGGFGGFGGGDSGGGGASSDW